MAPSLVLPADKSDSSIDDDHSDVELVYGFPDETETNFARERFPSKIGGKPVFLLGTAFETPRCSVCSCKLRFLLQIYAPVSENPAAFHRTLYIYVCTNSSCTLIPGPDSVVVIRAQLPRRNLVYPYNYGEDEVKALDSSCCVLCGGKARERCGGCAAVQYCGRDCQKEDWTLGHKFVCKRKAEDCADAIEKLQENRKKWLFREVALETAVYSDDEDEDWSDEDSESDEDEGVTITEVLDDGGGPTENGEVKQEANGKSNGSDDPKEPISRVVVAADPDDNLVLPPNRCKAEEGTTVSKGALDGLVTMQDASAEELPESLFKSRFRADAVFDRFTRVTSYPPDQVVRYQRGGAALWMHSAGQYQSSVPSEKKRCKLCGGTLTFELQVLPQLLYYINPKNIGRKTKSDEDSRASIGEVAQHLRDGLDWGVIAIWTCTASCATEHNQYVREDHVWLQPAHSPDEVAG